MRRLVLREQRRHTGAQGYIWHCQRGPCWLRACGAHGHIGSPGTGCLPGVHRCFTHLCVQVMHWLMLACTHSLLAARHCQPHQPLHNKRLSSGLLRRCWPWTGCQTGCSWPRRWEPLQSMPRTLSVRWPRSGRPLGAGAWTARSKLWGHRPRWAWPSRPCGLAVSPGFLRALHACRMLAHRASAASAVTDSHLYVLQGCCPRSACTQTLSLPPSRPGTATRR